MYWFPVETTTTLVNKAPNTNVNLTHPSLNLFNLSFHHDMHFCFSIWSLVWPGCVHNLRRQSKHGTDGYWQSEGDLVKGQKSQRTLGEKGSIREAELTIAD